MVEAKWSIATRLSVNGGARQRSELCTSGGPGPRKRSSTPQEDPLTARQTNSGHRYTTGLPAVFQAVIPPSMCATFV